jgi:hypothetical protein
MTQRPFTPDLFAAGLALIGSGTVVGEAAWLHMRELASQMGSICGSAASPHCAPCYVSAAALFAGLACFAASATGPRLAHVA